MRRLLIAGNWKMNLKLDSAKALAQGLKDAAAGVSEVDIAVCPPSLYVQPVCEILNGSNVGVGAQNAYFEAAGAFTGELEMAMLTDVGCQYVILGHSERRTYFAETDETVNKRARAALAAGLKTIICVGETLEQREGGVTEEVVCRQTVTALLGMTAEDLKNVVIAYEPVWAIGTGKTATKEQAAEVCGFIRKVVEQNYSTAVAEALTIQYGGSMNAGNAADLLSMKDIDGGLIGGAALKPADFAAIIEAASK